MALPADYIRRAVYGKYLLRRADELLRKKTLLSAGEALLALQDGAEMVMRVIGDHLGLPPRYEFLEFWARVKEKTGMEPAHKSALDRVNVARVGFKHKGNAPDRSLVSGFQPLVQEFCIDICDQYLDHLDFEKVSLATLVSLDKVRILVQESESLFEAGSRKQAMEKLGLAFEDLYGIAQQEANHVLARPPEPLRVHTGVGELRQYENYFEKFTEDHARLANIVNMQLLGIDPHAFFYFKSMTPNFIRTGYQQTIVSVGWPSRFDENSLSEEVFERCRDFVIEFSLRNDELFRA